VSDRVIYVAATPDKPIGGIRVLYQHVELLTAAGYDAAVWHPKPGMTHGWFDSSVPHVYGARLELDATDTLVIPECVVENHDPAPGCRKVIYNQNYFLTFASVDWPEFPAWDPTPPIWTSSDTSVTVLTRLRGVLPIDTVDYIPLAIDPELFRSDPSVFRERKIVWMPRKRREEAQLLHALLASDSRFDDVVLRPLDGLATSRIAAELASASVFVALGRDEGFRLPVAEALASGCAVVGYPAGGGAELFDAPGAHPIADPDTPAIVDRVADVLENEPSAEERATYRGVGRVEIHHVPAAKTVAARAAGRPYSACPGRRRELPATHALRSQPGRSQERGRDRVVGSRHSTPPVALLMRRRRDVPESPRLRRSSRA